VLQTCAVGRDRWEDVATCADRICDPVGAQCDVCVANQFSCDDAQLQQCGPSGQVLEARGTCRDAAHCYASGPEGYCYVCDPGDTQCSGAHQIQECTIDRGGFGAPTPCEHGCQDEAGNADYCAGCPLADEVACVEESRPGSTRRCPADRRAWGPAEPCAAGLGCVNDGTADYCADTCAPNQASCVGETGVHTCSADGEGFSPTRYECANATSLRRCVGGVLSATEGVACPAATPFCVDGACVECVGATRECVPDTTARRECVNGTWQLENCAARTDGNVVCYRGDCASCNAASPAACLDDDTLRRCVEGTYATTECTGATPACNPVTGECAACNASSPATCIDATTRQSCATSTGTWTTTTCAVRCLVVAGQASCVACDPDATPATCTTDDGIQTCSPGGVLITTPCVAPAPVCALIDGETRCVGCASGSCTGATPFCLDGVECVECEPGTTTCRQEPVAAGACRADGSWEYAPCTGATPLCSGGRCVECAGDGDCPATGQSCQAGQCRCPSGQAVCDVACVDLTSDDAHCGDCETDCTTTSSPYCLDGACVQCRDDGDCVGTPTRPHCDASHACVP